MFKFILILSFSILISCSNSVSPQVEEFALDIYSCSNYLYSVRFDVSFQDHSYSRISTTSNHEKFVIPLDGGGMVKVTTSFENGFGVYVPNQSKSMYVSEPATYYVSLNNFNDCFDFVDFKTLSPYQPYDQ